MNSSTLHYVTGNPSKFASAQNNMRKYGIELTQLEIDIAEIQAATTEDVALDKATKAFALVQEPLLVSDHGWSVTALNGFPGPYMKYVNSWYQPADFLSLMSNHENREVFLHQNLVYIDGTTRKLFTHTIRGYVLNEARGSLGTHWDKVVCITNDNKSIAESREISGKRSVLFDEPEPWLSLATWYKTI